jgi:hypothetical protein
MKGLAALGAAGLIAAAGALWLLSNPILAGIRIVPVKPSAELPRFKHVPTPLEGESTRPQGGR